MWCRLLVAWLLFACARPAAAAEPSDEAREAATTLFEEGRELFAQGKYDEACTRLEAARQLIEGVGIIFNLAECYEKLGKTASAWRQYLHVVSITVARGDSTRAEAARERASSLETSLSRVRVVVRKPVAGMSVEIGGTIVPEAQWGSSFPVDPGEQIIIARADGHRPLRQTIAVAASAGELSVDIAPLVALAGDEPPPAPVPVTAERSPFDSPFTIPGFVTAGVGVVTVITGAIVMGVGASKESDAAAACPDRGAACPQDVADSGNTGIVMQDAGLVALIIGAITTAGGGALVAFGFLGTFDDEQAARTRVLPQLVASPMGAYGGFSVEF